MTDDSSSEVVACPPLAPASIRSSSSSGDEGCAPVRRRWSMDAREKDVCPVPSQSLDSSSFAPTFDIPSDDAYNTPILHAPSTPPSPAKEANLNVNAMFQGSGISQGFVDAPRDEEEDAEASAAAAETTPDDTYSELGTSLSALSKISLPSVTDELIAWANQSKEESDGRTVSAIVDLVFKKAIENAAKSELYAQLCYTVMEHFDPDRHDAQMETADDDLTPRPQVFRRRLLDLCQDEFERELGEDGDSTTDASQQFVGVIKFIGELFIARVFTRKMMYDCIQTLLAHLQSTQEPGQCIDGLEVLLTTAGRSLESRKAREHMDVYFAEIQVLSQSSAATPVHKRKLQALIETRRSWKTPQVAQPTAVGDDSVWGHALGEMNITSHRRHRRPSHTDPFDPWQVTDTKPTDMSPKTGELPLTPILSESDATLRAEKNAADFLSARNIAAAERYFEQISPGYHHLLVHAFVSKAIFFDADASLVATLFESVAQHNLCSSAAFEEGFVPTVKHLAGMAAHDVPDALESYARMFKGAGLGADEDLCMRIANMTTQSDELLLLLFSPSSSAALEPVPSLEPSPSASLNGLEPPTAVPASTPSSGWSQVTDDSEEAPSLEPAPPYDVDSGRQSPRDDDEDDLYADYVDLDRRAISSLHTTSTPAVSVSQQPRAAPQVAASNPARRAADRVHVQARIPEPPAPSTFSDLPLARARVSQQDANARIEQTFAQLFGGPHDIDAVLSVFAAVPARHHGRLVDRLVSFATESTPADAQLVAYFFYCAAAQGLCTRAAFDAGFAVTAAGLEEVAAESPDAVLLFATMARGAGLHKDADWRKRVFGRLERIGYGRDLASLSSSG